MKNTIINVDTDKLNDYKNYLDTKCIISTEHNEKIKKVLDMSISHDGMYCTHIFLKKIQETFKELYDSGIHIKHYLFVTNIDNRKNKNNESIFLSKIFCYYFIIKILSHERNGFDSIIVEKNISSYINEKITFANECPHFVLYITHIPNIKNEFCEKKLTTNSNVALIYHNIRPWTLSFGINSAKITDLSSLIHFFVKNNKTITHEYVCNVMYNILFQIIFSLCVLDKHKISHNDLRTANILLENGYEYGDNVDCYVINYLTNCKATNCKATNCKDIFYVPNYGFKIKIIDFGLTSIHNDKLDALKFSNPNSKYHELVNEAGIYNAYSDIYDLHFIINEIYVKLKDGFENLSIFNLCEQIVNKKYIGTNKVNNFVNEHWRLGFPYEISEFINSIPNDPYTEYETDLKNIQLIYENNKLIVTRELKTSLCNYILDISREKKLDQSIINNIMDPLDNNKNLILKPKDAIKLFKNYLQKHTNEISVNEISTNEIPVNEISTNEIPINEIPVNEIPVNEIPVNEIPNNEISVGATDTITTSIITPKIINSYVLNYSFEN